MLTAVHFSPRPVSCALSRTIRWWLTPLITLPAHLPFPSVYIVLYPRFPIYFYFFPISSSPNVVFFGGGGNGAELKVRESELRGKCVCVFQCSFTPFPERERKNREISLAVRIVLRVRANEHKALSHKPPLSGNITDI